MALSTTGFGLKPINKLGSNYTAAPVTEYKVWGYYGGFAFQDPVRIFGSAAAVPYRGNQKFAGSFVGVQYEDSSGKPIFADYISSTNLPSGSQEGWDQSTRRSIFVTDDPFQLYEVKTNGIITLSLASGNYQLADVGDRPQSSDGKTSAIKLDAASRTGANNSALPMQFVSDSNIEGTVEYSDSAYGETNSVITANSNVIVAMNKSTYKAGFNVNSSAGFPPA